MTGFKNPKAAAKARWERYRASRLPLQPYAGSFLDFLEAVGRGGPSRATWRVFWKAADGLPLDADELAVFQLHTGRTTAPTSPARECWLPAGRRGGKSENVVARATWRAIGRDWRRVLSPGEMGVIPIIASDRKQAANSLRYLKGLVDHPVIKPYVGAVLQESIEFATGAIVQVVSANFRSVRGFTYLDVLLEECAFYYAEDSANPDVELLTAVRPAMLTVPDARVYGISSPYARRGILWDAYEQHWGRDSDVLVFCADTLSLYPMMPEKGRREIEREWADDPAKAAAEYGRDGLVAFRQDVQAFLSREAVEAVIVPGRYELPCIPDTRYVAFVDPSGGSQDSFTLAIAHASRELVTLDCLRVRRPPFNPSDVVQEFAATLASYGVAAVGGDRYAGEWPREQFKKHGITYTPTEQTKSELYGAFLPLVNSQRVALLDDRVLRGQLVALERRVARSGKDSIDHPIGAHDDVANVVAGVCVQASVRQRVPTFTAEQIARMGLPNAAPWTRAGQSGIPVGGRDMCFQSLHYDAEPTFRRWP